MFNGLGPFLSKLVSQATIYMYYQEDTSLNDTAGDNEDVKVRQLVMVNIVVVVFSLTVIVV